MCTQISTNCEVSVGIARLAVKIVLKSLYNHDVYLSIEDKNECKSDTYTANQIPANASFSNRKGCCNCLIKQSQNVKATVRYDTITHSLLDAESSSVALKFSNGFEYTLRPLCFAFEDHQQIVDSF